MAAIPRTPVVALVLLTAQTVGIDNGIGLTPPMGWRHWKAFYAHISQDIMEAMMDEMVARRPVDGVPTSLKDLGYLYVGLDDHWQNCTTFCANGTMVPSWLPHGGDYSYQCCRGPNGKCEAGSRTDPWYEDDGTPRVDTHRFPDMKGMVDKAHRLGLRAGWYMGNYQCMEGMGGRKWNLTRLAEGSVRAIKEYGFDSVKLDSGFPVGRNMSLWAELLNASERPVMMENCHQGAEGPGMGDPNSGKCTGLGMPSDCPYNFWRTTGDPEPDWGTIMRELNSLRKVVNTDYPSGKRRGSPEYNADPPLSRPGAWAYPGTMVVGDGRLTKDENRVHFGAWCIVSSPLILAYNLSAPAQRELVWDIITNKEAIQVNQAWAGHPGSQVLAGLGNNSAVEVWAKPLGEGRLAVFIVNTEDNTKDRRASVSAGPRGPGPALGLAPCAAGAREQEWAIAFDAAEAVATVRSAASGGCIEVHGCSTADHARVDTDWGCKPLPAAGAKGCDLNMAWRLGANGTITSAMDGKCLEVVGHSVDLFACSGAATQRWEVVGVGSGASTVREASGHRRCLSEVVPGGATVTLQLADLNITSTRRVRDVWAKRDLPATTGGLTLEVPHHGSAFLVLVPPGGAWPVPFELAPWLRRAAPQQKVDLALV